MREILFRGKTYDGEWENGSLLIQWGEMTNDGEREREYLILGMRGESRFVIPETVGQYTGLKDKNGKRIFEGDIVDILTENEEIGVIEYEDGGFLVSADWFCVDFHTNINGTDLDVIGNIHDNGELMEER